MVAKAVIDNEGKVQNIVGWQEPNPKDPSTAWPIPEGCILVDVAAGAEPGGGFDGNKFTPAPQPVLDPKIPVDLVALKKQIDDASAKLALAEQQAAADALKP